MPTPEQTGPLPYKVAVLCDLRDARGRTLLIRRLKAPNQGLCSPIGGKLDMATGESPAQCARREILEEAGIDVPVERLRLVGMISERSFEHSGHWLLFWYRALGPVEVEEREIREGRLEWHDPADIPSLPLPETDRRIIWPLVRAHERASWTRDPGLGGMMEEGEDAFFAVHVDCSGPEMRWVVEQGRAGVRV